MVNHAEDPLKQKFLEIFDNFYTCGILDEQIGHKQFNSGSTHPSLNIIWGYYRIILSVQ